MTEKDKIPNTCSFVESREAKVTEAEIAALSDTLPENLLLIQIRNERILPQTVLHQCRIMRRIIMKRQI